MIKLDTKMLYKANRLKNEFRFSCYVDYKLVSVQCILLIVEANKSEREQRALFQALLNQI